MFEVIASCIATFIFQSSNNAFASPLVGALNSLSGSPFFLYRAVQPPLLFGNSDPSPLTDKPCPCFALLRHQEASHYHW